MTFPDSLLVESLALANQQQVKIVTLNKPKALNALDLDMAKALLAGLQMWAKDGSVAAVVLCGQGEKAFCAGGDVVSMYHAMREQKGRTPLAVETFFTAEYELDHLIHTYHKPIIVIGQGYVMGGGMGLYAGASHRLVTPSTKLAMPEVTIGLYPDVGGSYFLPRLPQGVGLFLGLTGVPFSSEDALHAGFAEAMIEDNAIESVKSALVAVSEEGHFDHSAVDKAVQRIVISSENTSHFVTHKDLFTALANASSLQDAARLISEYNSDDKWITKAQRTFSAGSPITAHLVWQQIQRGTNLTLAECFRMELNMSCQCAATGEFEEGVRALLIEKDGNPKWLYPSIEAVPQQQIEGFFESPWQSDQHPLAHLK